MHLQLRVKQFYLELLFADVLPYDEGSDKHPCRAKHQNKQACVE